jgi:hypothetical protein
MRLRCATGFPLLRKRTVDKRDTRNVARIISDAQLEALLAPCGGMVPVIEEGAPGDAEPRRKNSAPDALAKDSDDDDDDMPAQPPPMTRVASAPSKSYSAGVAEPDREPADATAEVQSTANRPPVLSQPQS